MNKFPNRFIRLLMSGERKSETLLLTCEKHSRKCEWMQTSQWIAYTAETLIPLRWTMQGSNDTTLEHWILEIEFVSIGSNWMEHQTEPNSLCGSSVQSRALPRLSSLLIEKCANYFQLTISVRMYSFVIISYGSVYCTYSAIGCDTLFRSQGLSQLVSKMLAERPRRWMTE